jgi:uncharacterized protein YndB with AHSA1/START domain
MDQPPVASVVIAASPERVFASMANADSLYTWMSMRPALNHGGMLVAGDSFPMATIDGSHGAPPGQRMTWIISEVKAPSLLVFDIRSDSLGLVMASIRDSLVARGDSTEVISTVSTFSIDSLTARAGTANKAAPENRAAATMVSKMMVIPFRIQAGRDLQKLKAHIEAAVPVDTAPRTPDSTNKKKGG